MMYKTIKTLHGPIFKRNHIKIIREKSEVFPTTWCARRTFFSSKISLIRNKRHGGISEASEVSSVDTSSSRVPPNRNIENLLTHATTFEESEHTDHWHTDPYGKLKKLKRKEVKPVDKSYLNIDPRDTTVILFPGQGTHSVGMCKNLLTYPNVQDIYDAASEILGYDTMKLSLEGPIEKLKETKYQQIAVFLASMAAVEKLRAVRPDALGKCAATAGFSLGEISALTFAEAISFDDAVRLIAVRGESMQIASEMNPTAMATVFVGADSRLGFACEVAVKYCKENGISEPICKVVNYLFSTCKVVAGHEEAIHFIIERKDEFRLRRIRKLDVSGAFHTEYMRPAAEVFAEALAKVEVSNPVIAVHSNIDGKRYKDEKKIVKLLPKQMYTSVRWEQTLHYLYNRPQEDGFPQTFECGPGRTLNTILKVVNGKAWRQMRSTDDI